MKLVHPEDPSITWESGKRGRPPKWVTDLRNKKKEPVKVVSHTKGSGKSRVVSEGTYSIDGCVTYIGDDAEVMVAPTASVIKI